jgi:hypothetical protein
MTMEPCRGPSLGTRGDRRRTQQHARHPAVNEHRGPVGFARTMKALMRPERLLAAAPLAPPGSPCGRSTRPSAELCFGACGPSSLRDRRRCAPASKSRAAICRTRLVCLSGVRISAYELAGPAGFARTLKALVRPERFELPASWFVARRSIQLSYGRNGARILTHWAAPAILPQSRE